MQNVNEDPIQRLNICN